MKQGLQKIEALGLSLSLEEITEIPKGYLTPSDIHTVCRYTKKIRSCSIGQVESLIGYIMLLTGTPQKSLPEKNEDISLVMDIMHEELGKYSIEEVKVAFKMAVNKKFQCNFNFYDRPMNPESIIAVIIAYREHCTKNKLIKPLIEIAYTEETLRDIENFYKIKKKRILQLVNSSIKTGLNKFEEIKREEAAVLFESYKDIVWKGTKGHNLWKKCGIDLEIIEKSNIWKEAIEIVKKENLKKGDRLKDLINGVVNGADRVLIMKIIKHKLLIKMMHDKLSEKK